MTSWADPHRKSHGIHRDLAQGSEGLKQDGRKDASRAMTSDQVNDKRSVSEWAAKGSAMQGGFQLHTDVGAGLYSCTR